jgi:hypothetical protein
MMKSKFDKRFLVLLAIAIEERMIKLTLNYKLPMWVMSTQLIWLFPGDLA